MSFKLLIIIIFVSLVLAAGLLGYRLFYQDPSTSQVASSGGVSSGNLLATDENNQINANDVEYTRLLRAISQIDSIDNSVFSSPVFVSLFNFRPDIPNLNPGRSNPFAPIGVR